MREKSMRRDGDSIFRHFHFKGCGTISLFKFNPANDHPIVWKAQYEFLVWQKNELPFNQQSNSDPSGYGATIRGAIGNLRLVIAKMRNPEIKKVDDMLQGKILR